MADDCQSGQRTGKSDRWALTLRDAARLIEELAPEKAMNLNDDLLAKAVRALVNRAEQLLSERDTALALLRRWEWAGQMVIPSRDGVRWYAVCLSCGRQKDEGHNDVCDLAAFLAAHPEGKS
jgi:hypothetical protein